MESIGPSSEQTLEAYCETPPYSVLDLNRSIQYTSTKRYSLLVPSYLFSISAYMFKGGRKSLTGAKLWRGVNSSTHRYEGQETRDKRLVILILVYANHPIM
jgi:hypothetical protein